MLLPLHHLLSLWKLAHRRLLAERALALALLAGWLAAVALIAAIPMYTDAINQALLRRELRAEGNSRRPSFAFLFHYTAGTLAQARWDNYLALNQYLETRLADELGLPLQMRMHYVRSDLFQLYPAVGGQYNLSDDPLTRVDLGFIAESEPHLDLVEGQSPSPTWEPGQPLEVLLSQQLAADLGLQVGEEYAIFDPGSSDRAAFTGFIRVAGIWRARDADDPFWYIPPEAFDRTLLVSSGTYIGLLGNQIPRPLFDIGWYHVFDGGAVRAEDVSSFLRRVTAVETHIASLLPGAQLALSPTAALKRYQEAVSAQSVLILLLGLPMIGLVLIFLALTADSAVITAWSNDSGYEDVFARQVEALGQPGDALIAISTSGKSQNLVRAFKAAQGRGLKCIGILGRDGGELLQLSDIAVTVPSSDTQRIQEVQIVLIHLLCELVEERLTASGWIRTLAAEATPAAWEPQVVAGHQR